MLFSSAFIRGKRGDRESRAIKSPAGPGIEPGTGCHASESMWVHTLIVQERVHSTDWCVFIH